MSGTMNGAPFARREFKFPVIRGSKFARVAIEAKSIVAAAIKSGAITRANPGICPKCFGPSASDEVLCVSCRSKKYSTLTPKRGSCPLRTLMCACGKEFETRQSKQDWCTRQCRNDHKKRRNSMLWQVEIPCGKCSTPFVRTRPQSKYCKSCSPYSGVKLG